jgi:hypothetical protein
VTVHLPPLIHPDADPWLVGPMPDPDPDLWAHVTSCPRPRIEPPAPTELLDALAAGPDDGHVLLVERGTR